MIMTQAISADKIKQLRERTGVSMGKCKEALEVAGGDMEKAIDHLRKTGIASAVKKEGRETKEGVVSCYVGADTIALVEVNSETDFVAQNDKFKQLVRDIAEEAATKKMASLEAFLPSSFSKDKSLSVDGYRALVVQTLGENIQIKRIHLIPKVANRSYGIYSHMGGKILCLVEISGASDQDMLAKDIAMHIAAESPEYLKPEEVPSDVKAREEEIAKSQIKGKPENMIGRIVEGKLNAFYDQVCLLRQNM